MKNIVYQIISNHKHGNDYQAMLLLLKKYPESISNNLLLDFLKNDNYQFSLLESPLNSQNSDIYIKELEKINFKNNIVEYMIKNLNYICIDSLMLIVKNHYNCTGLALNKFSSFDFNNLNEPPLHFAIKNKYFLLSKVILESGYDVKIIDKIGKSAFFYVQDIESFEQICKFLDFSEIKYTEYVRNIFEKNIIKNSSFCLHVLDYFLKKQNNINSSIINMLNFCLSITNSKKFLKYYKRKDKKDISIMDKGRTIYPLCYASMIFLERNAYLNYSGIDFFKECKNNESLPGIKDGLFAHFAYTPYINNFSAFFEPEEEEKQYFLKFFKKNYINKTYNKFIQDMAHVLCFIEDNRKNKNDNVQYYHNINIIFQKHFKFSNNKFSIPYFQKNIFPIINDSFLINLLKIFNLYNKANIQCATYYISKKTNKNTSFKYYGNFQDNGDDILYMEYILQNSGENIISNDIYLKIFNYSMQCAILVKKYFELNGKSNEKNLKSLSNIINICCENFNEASISKIIKKQEEYFKIIDDIELKNIKLLNVIQDYEYFHNREIIEDFNFQHENLFQKTIRI